MKIIHVLTLINDISEAVLVVIRIELEFSCEIEGRWPYLSAACILKRAQYVLPGKQSYL
jgi:hypothetical protein